MIRRTLFLFSALALVFGLAVVQPSPALAAQDVHFTAPSGNIDCWMSADNGSWVNCLVEEARWKASQIPKQSDCDLDWSPNELTLSLTPKVAIEIGSCRGDIGSLCGPIGTNDGCSVLGYGKSKTVGGITCTSAKTGVTCVTNGRKRGFTVNKAGYKTF